MDRQRLWPAPMFHEHFGPRRKNSKRLCFDDPVQATPKFGKPWIELTAPNWWVATLYGRCANRPGPQRWLCLTRRPKRWLYTDPRGRTRRSSGDQFLAIHICFRSFSWAPNVRRGLTATCQACKQAAARAAASARSTSPASCRSLCRALSARDGGIQLSAAVKSQI